MRSRLERLIAIEDLLRRATYPNMQRLCEMFDVKPRTMFADLRDLKLRMGLQIKYDRLRDGYYNADPEQRLPAFDLTESELIAIALASEMLCQYSGPTFEPLLEGTLQKIWQRCPERTIPDLTQIRRVVRVRAGAMVPVLSRVFMDLFTACVEHRRLILIPANGSGIDSELLLEPYKLVFNGDWYLAAYTPHRGNVQLLPLSMFGAWRPAGSHFTPLQEEAINAWLDKSIEAH